MKERKGGAEHSGKLGPKQKSAQRKPGFRWPDPALKHQELRCERKRLAPSLVGWHFAVGVSQLFPWERRKGLGQGCPGLAISVVRN